MSDERTGGAPSEEPEWSGSWRLSPISWTADLLGCSEGRVYTILIGLVLSLAMARLAFT